MADDAAQLQQEASEFSARGFCDVSLLKRYRIVMNGAEVNSSYQEAL